MKFTALYYSHNRGNPVLLDYCLRMLEKAVVKAEGMLLTVTWLPVPYGNNCVYGRCGAPSHRHMYQQIAQGLCQCPADKPVCLCEHDVLYPPEYFADAVACIQSAAPASLVYNRNVWMLNHRGFFPFVGPYTLTSNCAAMPSVLLRGVTNKMRECEESATGKPVWAEFGEETAPVVSYQSTVPVVDLRHDGNFTGMRDSEEARGELAPWGKAERYRVLLGVTP